jgi:hypothetical protein
MCSGNSTIGSKTFSFSLFFLGAAKVFLVNPHSRHPFLFFKQYGKEFFMGLGFVEA